MEAIGVGLKEMALMNLNRHHLSPLNERYRLPGAINHTLGHRKRNQRGRILSARKRSESLTRVGLKTLW